MKEQAILLGPGNALVGIITEPENSPNSRPLPAVMILNSGLVHRVGLNRLHVKLARTLANMGFVVLRFDFSGIGDSPVRRDHLPVKKSVIEETRAAMDYLQAEKDIHRFVLMGICSGAAISLKTACVDQRITGIVMINARGHLHGDDAALSASLRNRTLLHHYWRILLHSSFRTKNWKKALTGKIMDYRSILKMMVRFPLKKFWTRRQNESLVMDSAVADLRRLTDRGVHLFHIYAEGDEGLDYFNIVLGDHLPGFTTNPKLSFETIPGANHTFTLLWSQAHLVNSICKWMNGNFSPNSTTLVKHDYKDGTP